MRNQAKQTPIVVMTVHDDEEAALQALQLDIQDYLIKREITGNLLKRSIRYAIQRKRDMEALRQSEQRFSSFMLHLPALALVKDPMGRYVYGNAEQERVLSKPFPEYSGKPDEEFLPLETARQLRENDEQVLNARGRPPNHRDSAPGQTETINILSSANSPFRGPTAGRHTLPASHWTSPSV